MSISIQKSSDPSTIICCLKVTNWTCWRLLILTLIKMIMIMVVTVIKLGKS